MATEPRTTDFALFNMDSKDERLHANVLVVYEDDKGSPSCTAAFVGHLLRYDGNAAVPFESGSLITTVPFRIETSRLGKPVDRLTYDDLASLRSKYQLAPDTPFTMVLRNDVAAPPEELFAHDVQYYATIFYKQRVADIEKEFLAAEAQAQQLMAKPDSSVSLLFGIEDLPVPVESAVFSLPVTELEKPVGKAHALLWHLIRRQHYAAKLTSSSAVGAGSKPAVALRIHPHNDGTCCIGLQMANPLMLVGQEPELAHFHRVASSVVEAGELARISAELISRQFTVNVSVEVAETTSHRFDGPRLGADAT